MQGLKCRRDEAESIYEYDSAVERNEATEYDLPPDKLAIAKSYMKSGTRKMPVNYQFKTRKRKENATKGGIIAEIADFLEKNGGFAVEKAQIVNKERLITFEIGDEKFELTLVQKRRKKE